MLVDCILVLLAVAGMCCGCGSDKDRCLRFGGGSCCPQLNPLDRDLGETQGNKPGYIVLLPKNGASTSLDNICVTLFPVPDGSNTYHLYESRVYNDGSNEVESLIISQPEEGVRTLGNGLCQISETVFAQTNCENNVYLTQRCYTYGDCGSMYIYESASGVFGFSDVQRPISRACLARTEDAIRNNGLPDDTFVALPMRLPSQCVLNQVCSVASALQTFCQTVGVAFPTVNRCFNGNPQ